MDYMAILKSKFELGMVTAVDDAVGEVVVALKETNMWARAPLKKYKIWNKLVTNFFLEDFADLNKTDMLAAQNDADFDADPFQGLRTQWLRFCRTTEAQ